MSIYNSETRIEESANGSRVVIEDYDPQLTALQGLTGGVKKITVSATGTASAYPTASTISFGYNESLSTLTIFVKNADGHSLSGRIVVGALQSATAWTNVLGPTL